jgi:ATP-dependent DNA helicase RecG
MRPAAAGARLAERLLREHPQVADRVVARWVGGAARFAAA